MVKEVVEITESGIFIYIQKGCREQMCSTTSAMICGVGEVPYRLLSSHTRIFEQARVQNNRVFARQITGKLQNHKLNNGMHKTMRNREGHIKIAQQ